MAPDLLGDLEREAIPAVVHGEHDGEDLEAGVEPRLDGLDRGEEVGEPLEREVLRLDGDDDAVRCREGVDGEEPERRWAVDENGVVAGEAGERCPQPELPRQDRNELYLRTRHLERRGQEIEAADGCRDDGLSDRLLPQQDAVDGPVPVLPHSEAAGGVRLRVEVDDEHAGPSGGQGGAQADRGGGLAHPALLVADGDGGHRGTRRTVCRGTSEPLGRPRNRRSGTSGSSKLLKRTWQDGVKRGLFVSSILLNWRFARHHSVLWRPYRPYSRCRRSFMLRTQRPTGMTWASAASFGIQLRDRSVGLLRMCRAPSDHA